MSSEIVEQQAAMLCNRVRKNLKRMRKWLKREDIQCYRLYDRDIPEIPLAIDWYQGRLHVAEFKRKSDNAALCGEAWIRDVVAPLAQELGVDSKQVYYKVRNRQRGQTQYQAKGTQSNRMTVTEGGHSFLVNLVDYLDTGLFLDHRETRAMVAREAEGKAVLNLFCYTGSFSVYAAKAGAGTTLSIDLSATYLEWARANLELNGLEAARNRLWRGDVQAELLELRRSGERFDLVVVDPPTFSNSKRLDDVFDVQRDHVALLDGVRAVLATGGVVYFSTNHRRFQLETEQIAKHFEVAEISHKTVPDDFRNKKIHRCWRLVAKQ